MRDATGHTGPRSYSKVLQSFRTAACRARRTDLGRAMSDGFVAELCTQHAPTSVEHGFRHPCPRQSRAADVANDDQSMRSNESSRDEMQIMPSAIGDLRVDRLRTGFASSALRCSQLLGVLLQMARIGDLLTRRTGRERFQTQVDPDLGFTTVLLLCDFNLQVQIPTTARILSERTCSNYALNRPREPQAIVSAEEDRLIATDLNRSRLEGNPSQRFLAAPSWSATILPSRLHKLGADILHSIRVQAEFTRRAYRQVVQIVGRWRASEPSLRRPLCLAAEVPNEIHGPRLPTQSIRVVRIFDSIAIGQNHALGSLNSNRRGAGLLSGLKAGASGPSFW